VTDQHQSRHHRRSKTPPPPSSRVRSPSPPINQPQSRHHRRSKTPPPPSSRVRSPSPSINQPQSRHHRRSKTPPPPSSRVRSPSPVTDQHQSRHHRRSKTPPSQVRLPSPTVDQHQRRSQTPPPSSSRVYAPSPRIVDQPEIDKFQSFQQDVNTTRANPAPSSSTKRRKRWENEEEFNERQSLAQAAQHASLEEELRMIAQTSAAQLEPSDHYANIPQQSQGQTTVSKSKWDDEDDMYVYLFE